MSPSSTHWRGILSSLILSPSGLRRYTAHRTLPPAQPSHHLIDRRSRQQTSPIAPAPLVSTRSRTCLPPVASACCYPNSNQRPSAEQEQRPHFRSTALLSPLTLAYLESSSLHLIVGFLPFALVGSAQPDSSSLAWYWYDFDSIDISTLASGSRPNPQASREPTNLTLFILADTPFVALESVLGPSACWVSGKSSRVGSSKGWRHCLSHPYCLDGISMNEGTP